MRNTEGEYWLLLLITFALSLLSTLYLSLILLYLPINLSHWIGPHCAVPSSFTSKGTDTGYHWESWSNSPALVRVAVWDSCLTHYRAATGHNWVQTVCRHAKMPLKCQMAVRVCIICGISVLLLSTLSWIVAAARERLHRDKWVALATSAHTASVSLPGRTSNPKPFIL